MSNEIENRLSEDVHYQIIPQEETDGWDVRILEEYPETVIRFGQVSLNGETDMLHFDMQVVFSPDENVSLNDLTFTQYCSRILSAIITDSLEEGSGIVRDVKTNQIGTQDPTVIDTMKEMFDEYQFGTDGSEEPTD